MKALRPVLGLGVTVFVLEIIEGLGHRDPHVILANGYAIGAICWGCPCFLTYRSSLDTRQYSHWKANLGTGGKYSLNNEDSPYEWLEFDSEEEWRRAWRDKNAAPSFEGTMLVEDITAFNTDGRYVFGDCGNGWFIFDMEKDLLEAHRDAMAWEAAVRSKTMMDPKDLTDPKAWYVQSRQPCVYYALAIAAAIMLPWALAPLWRRSQSA